MKLKSLLSSDQVCKNLDNRNCVIELKHQSKETSDQVIDSIMTSSLTCLDILLA